MNKNIGRCILLIGILGIVEILLIILFKVTHNTTLCFVNLAIVIFAIIIGGYSLRALILPVRPSPPCECQTQKEDNGGNNYNTNTFVKDVPLDKIHPNKACDSKGNASYHPFHRCLSRLLREINRIIRGI